MILHISDFGTDLSTDSTAESIRSAIWDALSREEDIVLDFAGVEKLEKSCSRQIFRRLYIELGANSFYERIFFQNTSESHDVTIRKSLIALE